jgi:D-sedoheptulose 7-phosphate isomerase
MSTTEEVAHHLAGAADAVRAMRRHATTLAEWGEKLAVRLGAGGKLLAAGNGGSAAEAQHLTAELVGRYRQDRVPYSAIALHAETSSLTAIGNDYGYAEVFARQVTAHARTGDVLLLLSTSGRSENLLRAVTAAHENACDVWAMTGPAPNPLADAADEAVCFAGNAAHVQETQLIAVHAICTAFESAVLA